MSKHICQNCDTAFHEADLMPIKNINQRVAAGEEMPSGECPDCGALCHPSKATFNHAFSLAFSYEEPALCKLCRKFVDPDHTHLHQGELVCDDCWDERLSITA